MAIVLSAAGVLTSWASYQAELWDGAQLQSYGRAGTYRVEASQAALDAGLTRAVEVSLFRAWAEARAEGDDEMAQFYEARFPPALRRAFPEWLAQRPFDDPDAPPSPFSASGYRQEGLARAAALERKGEAAFQDAIAAKHAADAFVRASVVMATAMFLGGIGQVFKMPSVRVGLTIMAALALTLGAVQMFRLPMLALGQHP